MEMSKVFPFSYRTKGHSINVNKTKHTKNLYDINSFVKLLHFGENEVSLRK